MISPTPGRMVWFYLANTRPGFAGSPGNAFAAVVASVIGDRMINICAFDANGSPHPMQSVYLQQEGEDKPAGDWCAWMPYQIGQARTMEAQKYSPPKALPAADVTNMPSTQPRIAQDDVNMGKSEDDPAHPPGSGGPHDPANTSAGSMTAGQKAEGRDGGRPTVGGLTPKDSSLPAPAAEEAAKNIPKGQKAKPADKAP